MTRNEWVMTMDSYGCIWRRFVCSCALTVAALAAAPGASAQETPPPEEAPGADGGQEAPAHKLEIGIGAKGGAMGMGATEVPEDCGGACLGPAGGGDPEIYGMFGVGYAVGPIVDARYDRTIGLETGLYFTDDSAEGTNEIQNQADQTVGEITMTQSTKALHVPLLLKASPPFDNVRPVFGLGLEFVLQQSSELDYESDRVQVNRHNDTNSVEATNYTLLQFTAGLEIDAGPVRIPIELRAGYNLGWDDSIDERLDIENPNSPDEQITYNGQHLGHFGLYTGVLYRWEIPM